MTIDSHYHLDPRIQKVEDLIACMDKHGIERTAIIPTMVDPFHLEGRGKQAGDMMRRALMSRLNPVGRIMYRTTVDSKGNFVLLMRKFRIYQSPDNGEIAAAVERYPERLVAWVFVNPALEDAVAEAQCWMEHAGAIGVKAHPFWHRYPVSRLDDVADLCRKKGWPMLVHLGGDRLRGDYRFLPERHPGLKIIYAHAGLPFYAELWKYVKGKQNVFVDLSSPYLDGPLVQKAVAALGPDKCLYGTDGPYGFNDINGQYDHSVTLSWVYNLKLNDAAKEKILGGNFKAIARQ